MTETSTLDPRAATVVHLRGTAAERVEHSSLRAVARQIGMSPTGLKKFLNGTTPYSPTLRKLRVWYLMSASLPTGQVSKEDADAALAVLTDDLRPEPRAEAVRGTLVMMARAYEASGKPRPSWIDELARQYATGS